MVRPRGLALLVVVALATAPGGTGPRAAPNDDTDAEAAARHAA